MFITKTHSAPETELLPLLTVQVLQIVALLLGLQGLLVGHVSVLEGLLEQALRLEDRWRLLFGQQNNGGRAVRAFAECLGRQTHPSGGIALAPRPLHGLVLGLALVRLAREEGLVILGAQVHVVKGQRLLAIAQRELGVLGAPQQTHRVLPHLALGYGRQGGATARGSIRAISNRKKKLLQ